MIKIQQSTKFFLSLVGALFFFDNYSIDMYKNRHFLSGLLWFISSKLHVGSSKVWLIKNVIIRFFFFYVDNFFEEVYLSCNAFYIYIAGYLRKKLSNEKPHTYTQVLFW